MNTAPIARFSQLSIGVPKISVRYGHFRPRYKPPSPYAPKKPAGWGEKLWVFHHITTGQIAHSFTEILDANKAMKQLPFNGKKTVPAKIRKDYWRPMAMIQFPEGQGLVGESVFQRLREFKRLHELSWGDEMFIDDEGKTRTRTERGRALNNQRSNAIADMAAVLGGAGAGNKMWRSLPSSRRAERVDELEAEAAGLEAAETEAEAMGKTEAQFDAESKGGIKTVPTGRSNTPTKVLRRNQRTKDAELVEVMVYWYDDQLKHFAEYWSPNVAHQMFQEQPVYAAETVTEEPSADGLAGSPGSGMEDSRAKGKTQAV